MGRRVVVTGMGAVSPLGLTLEASWQALLRQESGITTLTEALTWCGSEGSALDHVVQNLPSRVAAPVRWNPKHHKTTARNVQFALEAGRQAMEQANLLSWLTGAESNLRKDTSRAIDEHVRKRHERAGVSMGCGMFSMGDVTSAFQTLTGEGYRKLSPYFVPKSLPNSASARLSIEYLLLGPNCTSSTACAAGNHAIGDAYRIIQLNQADVMLAGGSEAGIDPLTLAGFCRLKALSTGFNNDPTRASRPFDTHRDGFVMGEGAAVLVLEELEHAKRRGATLLAEVVGYGLTGDGHHITLPSGNGAERAMRMALNSNGNLAANVDYINAHATSTPMGDEIEARAIERVFSLDNNRQDRPLFVSSTKGATGHLLGAAGALEACFVVQAIVDQTLPPTLNLETIGEDKPLFEHVLKTTKEREIRVAVNNSFGFGGTNASLVFQKIQEI